MMKTQVTPWFRDFGVLLMKRQEKLFLVFRTLVRGNIVTMHGMIIAARGFI